MPFYVYEHKETKEQVEVMRNFNEYERVPDETETSTDPNDKEKWERKIGRTLVTKGYTWGPGKGHW